MRSLYVNLALCLLALTACDGQNRKPLHTQSLAMSCNPGPYTPEIEPPCMVLVNQPSPDQQISPFVRRIYQDESGAMWFGTNGDGVIRYNGDSLEYFSPREGFGGIAVRSILGDGKGNIWFGTNGGLTQYSPGTGFRNYTEKDGLVNNDIWSLCIDRKGTIWVGTLEGVSLFNGQAFTYFDLPETNIDPSRGVTSKRIIHSIMEDTRGRMWLATNGGAFIYDASAPENEGRLTQITEEDGLCNKVVNCILEDVDGNFWFATHHNGVCRWDGTSFKHFNANDGVEGSEVWDLYEDSSGNIWFPTEGYGVFCYMSSGEYPFRNFSGTEGLASRAVQCTFEDKDGRIWCGGWLGLYRYNPSSPERNFTNLTKELPWD